MTDTTWPVTYEDAVKLLNWYQDELGKTRVQRDALKARVEVLETAVHISCLTEDWCHHCKGTWGPKDFDHAPDCIARSCGGKP